MAPSRSYWNGTTSALQPEEITTSFICVLSIKVPIRKNSGNLFNDPRICGEMVDFGKSDKMIKISKEVDKQNT